MILKLITLVFIIIKSMRCSIVVDSFKQEPIRMTKDCPEQRYCKNGTHVMCKYYYRNKLFGARCENLVKVEFTPNMIRYILKNVNYLRGKVATGKETGKDDEVLPRAYGLMKLEWDKDLAFSAQVLANQCFGDREDECRATDRFPTPSQSISIIRHKYPNWEFLIVKRRKADSKHAKIMKMNKGLDEIKLMFSVDGFLKSSHTSKIYVTKDIITKCPPLHNLADANLKHYLNLINGGVTHMGCGVSAYSININGDIKSKQNIVQIVCNFSDAPKENQPVYNLVPPIPGQGYTKRCGCPRGYKETRRCLCKKDSINLRRGLQLKNRRAAGLKQDSRRNIISSKMKDMSIWNWTISSFYAKGGQVAVPSVHPSRNIIIFRGNQAENLPKDKKVVVIKPFVFSQTTSLPMVTRFTRRAIRRRYFEHFMTNETHTPTSNNTTTKRPKKEPILKTLYSKFVETLKIYFKI